MLRYRLVVTSSVLVSGNDYALVSGATASLVIWLSIQRTDAAITTQMLAFVDYICGSIWEFATYDVWGGILLLAALRDGLFLIGRMTGIA